MGGDKIAETLYVTDLDGTLLNEKSEVSTKSASLLNEAISKGINFTIATARTPATVSHLLADVKMKLPAIVMTGAALWNFETADYSEAEFIEAENARRLVKIYQKAQLPVFIYTLRDNIIEILHLGEMSECEHQFMLERSKTRYKKFIFSDSDEPTTYDNIMLFYSMAPTARVEAVARQIKSNVRGVNPIFYHDIFGPEVGLLEVFASQTSKAAAIRRLADKIGAKRIVVFGDNVNDLPMMHLADCSIAVENALESVKNIADEVIGSNQTDAVAKRIIEDLNKTN